MAKPSKKSLPNNADDLKDMVRRLEMELQLKDEMIRLFRIQKYGAKSEKLSDQQLSLLEEEPGVRSEEIEKELAHTQKNSKAKTKSKKRRSHPGRIELPADLPRVEETIACTPEQCRCGQCGQATHVIGFEECEVLDVKPAEYFVRVIRREKRACQSCPEAGVGTAPAPKRIIDKGKLSNGMVVDAALKKYRDHLPVYRQCASLLEGCSIEIDRSTLGSNILAVGELCDLVSQAMKAELFAQGYIQADETPVGVQSGRVQGKNHQAYIFQYSHPRGIAIFDFQSSRERAGPKTFLEGYKGLLQTDGYTGYEKFGEDAIVRIGCMAHIRRKFVDAHKVAKDDPHPKEIIEQIAQLYQTEKEARTLGLGATARKELRQEKSLPVITSLKARIMELRQSSSVLPKSLLGKACTYALNQWDRTARYLDHGEAELDNNVCENGIRPVAVGRKNWLHIGSEKAGPKIAGIISILERCRRLDINARDYLLDVLPGLWDLPQRRLANLTPTKWKAQRQAAD